MAGEMRVIEFKLQPHDQAIASWEYQLEALKSVWNTALTLRIEADARYKINRSGLSAVCPSASIRTKGNKVINKRPTQWRTVASGVRRVDGIKEIKRKGKVIGVIAGPYCCTRRLVGVNPLDKTEVIDGVKVVCELSKASSISHYPWMDKNLADSKFLTGVYKSLATAWIDYKKGVKKRPRFKGKKDKLKSLANHSVSVKFLRSGNNNGLVKFPKMPPVKCKGLYRRYHESMNVRLVRVCKKGGEWFLQLTCKIEASPKKVQPSSKSLGLDPGVAVNVTASDGRSYHCKQSKRIEQRILKLQRKASRQWLMNGKQTKGHAKTQTEIARLKGKQARSRSAWEHKASSRFVAEDGIICIEDTQVKNMVRKPKPKKGKDGAYLPNGAKAKAGLNKAVLKSCMGGLRRKLETKAKAAGRDFVKVPAAYTSATCNACGYRHSKAEKPKYRPTQKYFICQACGHTDNADVNAAKNILDKGLEILAAERIVN